MWSKLTWSRANSVCPSSGDERAGDRGDSRWIAGYEQEFRAQREGRNYDLREQVSITPVAPGRWSLVGVITDVTAARQAEEARRASEARLQQILDRADCMLWQGPRDGG